MNSLSFLKNELIQTIEQHPKNAMKIAIQQVENALIEEALIICRGNVTRTAKTLGINRATLQHRLKKGSCNEHSNRKIE